MGRVLTGVFEKDPDWDGLAEEREKGSLSQVTGFISPDGVNEDNAIVEISAGEYHTLALSKSGHLYFFGSLRSGEKYFAFTDNFLGHNQTPVHVPVDGRVLQVHSGNNHCILRVETNTAVQLQSFGEFSSRLVLGRNLFV